MRPSAAAAAVSAASAATAIALLRKASFANRKMGEGGALLNSSGLGGLFNGTLGGGTSPGDYLDSICSLSDWNMWGPCYCGFLGATASRTRNRTLIWSSPFAGDDCRLLLSEVQTCRTYCVPPSVHCEWRPWQSWSACAPACGESVRSRVRGVRQQAARGGHPCQGPAEEIVACDAVCLRTYVIIWVVCLLAAVAIYTAARCYFYRLAQKAKPRILDEEDGEDVAGEEESANVAWRKELPAYWAASGRRGEAGGFHELVYVDTSEHERFNQLLAATYQARCTQDRPCPNGTCGKTQLGCPCVQPGGTPGLPVGYRIRRVIRVESSAMWRRYVRTRGAILASHKDDDEELTRFTPELCTEVATAKSPDAFAPLHADINEVYAFHGTSARSALRIAQEDFRIDLAGSSAGAMYGTGCYMAESCTKADEYALDEAGTCYDSIYAIIVARVSMGKYYYTTQRDDLARHKALTGGYDSTLGDRASSVGTFRELVVYDRDQVYPEYILLYQRAHRGDDPEEAAAVASQPFYLDLPIYWRNCHQDVRKGAFADQFRVRQSTLRLLQRLVHNSLSGGAQWHVVRARRVENSRLWADYTDFKMGLRRRLQQAADAVGETICKQFHGKDACPGWASHHSYMEDMVSLGHMEDDLGERILWHGTGQESAESIAVRGFRIPRTGEAEHGKRFGRGIYCTESLDKSLSYAAAEDGPSFVLLCRMASGRPFCTDEPEDQVAHLNARDLGKDSVLANPGGAGPLECVALQEDQVYPEYILELEVGPLPGSEAGAAVASVSEPSTPLAALSLPSQATPQAAPAVPKFNITPPPADVEGSSTPHQTPRFGQTCTSLPGAILE